jgi:ankyrin repeat protein
MRPLFAFPGTDLKEKEGEDLACWYYDQKDQHFQYPSPVPDVYKSQRSDELEAEDEDESTSSHDTSGIEISSQFGLRSLLHAMLEDGAFIKPILEFPGIDFENKDPQGRPLFLSMCRSALGADAAPDACMDDICRDLVRYSYNPYPETQELTDRTTLFQFFVNQGANLLATDNYGKNALFNLLESELRYDNQPALIRRSLQYLLKNVPQLVNQPDIVGNYPLHAALRRLRRFWRRNSVCDNSQLEAVVEDLLAAGADAKALDERGNTALHYLVNDGLALGNLSRSQLVLFQDFVKRGVDINARNNDGCLAMEFLLDDDPTQSNDWEEDPGSYADYVIDLLESAGAMLTETNSHGQNMLYLVASRKDTMGRATAIARVLLNQGVDALAEDGRGQTPYRHCT